MRTLKTLPKIGLLFFTMSLFSCSGQRPTNIGIINAKLSDCPASPNCVSSDAGDEAHKVLPFQLKAPAANAWLVVKQSVLKLPRSEVITENSKYLHAEFSSVVFGFVDDLELHLRPNEGIIAIRSASRLGYSDFGVNNKRLETLRAALIKHGAIQ